MVSQQNEKSTQLSTRFTADMEVPPQPTLDILGHGHGKFTLTI